MKITRYTDYILIEELKRHYLGYDEKTFIVEKSDGTTVPFLIEIVSEFSVKLLFDFNIEDEKIIIKIKTSAEEYLDIIRLQDILPPIIDDKENKKETFPISLEFDDQYIKVEYESELSKFNPEKLKIKIKEYSLEKFSDFYDESYEVPIEYDKFEDDNIDDDFDFDTEFKLKYPKGNIEKDKIYKIKVKYKKNKNEYYYIHKTPTYYFSSLYHLEKAANNLNLILNKDNLSEFDLKLIIWKNSKFVMGLVGATTDIIYDYNNSVLNEFVTKKCLLDFIAKGLKDSNLNPELATDTLKLISVSLGDFAHGASVETVTTQLIKVYNTLNKDLEELARKIPEIFRYLQSKVSVANNSYKGKTISRKTSFEN